MLKKSSLLVLLVLVCICGNAQKRNKKITDINKLETRFDGNYFVVNNCKLDLYDFNQYFKQHPEFQLVSKECYTAMEFGLNDTYVTSFKYVLKRPQTGPQFSDDAVKAFAIGLGVVEMGVLWSLFQKYAASAPKGSDYQISVVPDPVSAGAATSDYVYYGYGDKCTVHALPRKGHSFMCWMENGNVVSRDASYTFTVTRSRSLVAKFY